MSHNNKIIIIIQTYSEWQDSYLHQYKSNNCSEGTDIVKRLSTKGQVPPYPKTLDWRTKNAVSPVKNQVSQSHYSKSIK